MERVLPIHTKMYKEECENMTIETLSTIEGDVRGVTKGIEGYETRIMKITGHPPNYTVVSRTENRAEEGGQVQNAKKSASLGCKKHSFNPEPPVYHHKRCTRTLYHLVASTCFHSQQTPSHIYSNVYGQSEIYSDHRYLPFIPTPYPEQSTLS